MTNVPIPTLGPTGFIAPSEAAILAGVQADMNAAFGGGLNMALNTPQGQLASSIAAIIADCDAQFLQVISQVDPQYAQGRMQDAIGNIYFMTRLPATSTQVSGIAGGLPGTVIPAGVPVAVDAAGNLYACPSGGTIGSGGTVLLTFANQVTGPTPFTAPMTIYQAIPGWDTISSQALLGLGQDVETAQAFETRRQLSVAANANGSLRAIRAAVLASGLNLTPPQPPLAAYVIDNTSSSPAGIGGITIPGNSLYVAAVGGNAAAIAQAIWSKKDIGCSYAPSAMFTASTAGSVLTVTAVASGVLAVGQTVSGTGIPAGVTIVSLGTGTGGMGTYNLSAVVGTIGSESMTSATVVTVQDTSYSLPYPTYSVAFTVPVTTPINIAVTLAAASNPPSNSLALLQNPTTGLAMAFTGADGGAPFSIGSTIYGSRFFSTIAQIIPGATVLSVLVGSGSPTLTAQPLNINQYPTIGTITLALA